LQAKKLVISRDVEVDEYASWNWDEEKVEKNVLIPAQLPQEEAEEEDPGEPHNKKIKNYHHQSLLQDE